MKKALKIIDRLAKDSVMHTSQINVIKNEGKVIFETKENQVTNQIYYLTFFILPLVSIYFFRNFTDLFYAVVMIFCSIGILHSYFQGSFQTDNRIEIDLKKEEIHINRKTAFGSFTKKNKVFKTQKRNEVIKEDISFSDSIDIRLLLQIDEDRIPLIDLKNDSISDQVFLSLNLLVKHEGEGKEK